MSDQSSQRLTRDHGGWVVARWSGEIDMVNADDVGREALGGVANSDEGLVVDLSQVTYLDSAGIRTVVRLSRLLRQRQQLFSLVVPERSVLRSSLVVGGIPGMISTFRTLSEARAARAGA
ncbi:MAG TPA: STAS domain-containing protein [Actinomycetota bacterium]|nr:STAS domain-containing protein [Actinomycetota bacterium]